MMDLLPETVVNKFYKDKHNLEYIDSITHIKMSKQHYDDIHRYTKPIYGDKFPQIDINIPIEKKTSTITKNIIEIDTNNNSI